MPSVSMATNSTVFRQRRAFHGVRFAVVDTETTGLDPRRDRLITIGAVAVIDHEIVLGDSFEAMLKVNHNTAAVTIHGITRDQARHGMEEEEALARFLPWLGKAVITGHHIGHDVAMLNAALELNSGTRLSNRYLDTMDLTLHLEKAGAFDGQPEIASFSLDGLCRLFRVRPHDRHTAAGDALITAQVFLRLLKLADRFGFNDLDSLCRPFPTDHHE